MQVTSESSGHSRSCKYHRHRLVPQQSFEEGRQIVYSLRKKLCRMLALLVELLGIILTSKPFLVGLAGILLFLAHYLLFAVKKPMFFTGSPDFRRFLENHVPSLKRVYKPSLILPSGMLQSIFAVSFRPDIGKRLNMQREIFKFSDGGQAALDYVLPSAEECQDLLLDQNPLVVLIIPASFCSSRTTIVSSLADAVARCGSTAVILNYRGHGGVKFSSPKFNTYADCDDVQEVIPYIKDKFGCRLMAIGQSAGGMILAKYLSEYPEEAKRYLTASMMISVGWDLMNGYKYINPPHYLNSFLIQRQHLSWMKNIAKKYSKQIGGNAWKSKTDFEGAMKAETVYEFDQLLIVPQFGYESVEEYWKDASPRGKVLKFSIPVLCLNSQDDPSTPAKLLPYDEAEAPNSKLALLTTSRGGHNAFLEGFLPKSEHFVERLVREYVSAVKNHENELPKWT